jgi:multidrug efflux pump subunit AcrA (membrane-fusion protein)
MSTNTPNEAEDLVKLQAELDALEVEEKRLQAEGEAAAKQQADAEAALAIQQEAARIAESEAALAAQVKHAEQQALADAEQQRLAEEQTKEIQRQREEALASSATNVAAKAAMAEIAVATKELVNAVPAPLAIESLPEGVFISTAGKIVLATLDTYTDAMKPRKPVSDAECNRNQVGLYRNFVNMIENLDEDFNTVFTIVLKHIDTYSEGAFSERYVFRDFANLTLSKEDLKGFCNILNLLKVLANIETRALALRQVDLNASLQFPFTEAGRQRVLAYFGK